MTNNVKYYVRGHFEGNFKTFQDLNLEMGEPFPEGDKYLIRIYRGLISDSEEINQQTFDTTAGEFEFKEVNNIQINAGPKWPHPYDRIYSMGSLKLIGAKISSIQSLNGHTYGKINGYLIGSVVEKTFEENSLFKEDNNDTLEDQNNWWDYRQKKWWKDNFGPTEDNSGNNHTSNLDGGVNDNQGSNTGNNGVTGGDNVIVNRLKGCADMPRQGCTTLGCGQGCLTWIMKALAFLLLLYLILTLTNWGQQWVCRYQKWRMDKETKELYTQRAEMQDIINRTKPPVSMCGGQQDFEGDNQPRTFTYTLGPVSGPVLITYDMFDVPDRLEVMFNGDLVAETRDTFDQNEYPDLAGGGFASGQDTLRFNYKFKSNELHELTIRVVPNQQINTTKWEFKVKCP
ncbi:MAG: hypothetical protein LW688_09100 [Cryomorphaceae bacterium]|jgi:hypothetical protein|nr:hypothetical protein [Cryomorphaceae bacterium]